MHKILVVEDDDSIRKCIQDILSENNYLVDIAQDGVVGIELLKKQPPDLVILDLGLPKIAGESVLAEVKRTFSNIPVIILTARNHTDDVLKAFQSGADDYISKPFDLQELLARVKVKLKDDNLNSKINVGTLTLDTQRIHVEREGKEISLSPHEFKLLQYLMQNKGKVLSREMILNRIWQYSYDVDSRVVDVYVGYLRKKIDSGYKKKLINSIRGFGYVIKE